MKIRVAVVLGLLLIVCSGAAVAGLLDPQQSNAPVEVSANRLEADDAARTLVFLGNAVAKQGDVTIYAERLTVHYDATGNDVAQVVAEQQVRIVQGERVATGGRAVFDRTTNQVVLTGSPRVQEGANLVQGSEIVLYLTEKRSVVKGGEQGRVNAVFVPKAEKKP